MKRMLPIVLCFLVAGCGTSLTLPTPTVTPMPTPAPTQTPKPSPNPPRDYESLTDLYAYDASVPLDVTWGKERVMEEARVQEVSYHGTDACRAGAYLVQPAGSGPYPAVIYLHRVPATRSQFLDEAIDLAGQGVVSLLLDSPYDLQCYSPSSYTRQGLIDTVIFIRRGIDFLVSLLQVDAGRLAFVGHSFGSNLGGVLAGVDARIHSFVLMAGVANLSDYNSPAIQDLDAHQYISHADEGVFLFQFATNDGYINEAAATRYYQVASGEKSILWYEADHTSVQWLGEADRIAWLLQHLGVTVIGVE